jgi:hypothetical protein
MSVFDSVDGTPVLNLTPSLKKFGLRGWVRQKNQNPAAALDGRTDIEILKVKRPDRRRVFGRAFAFELVASSVLESF